MSIKKCLIFGLHFILGLSLSLLASCQAAPYRNIASDGNEDKCSIETF